MGCRWSVYGVLAMMGEEWTTCDKLLSFLADARDMRTGQRWENSGADGRSNDTRSVCFCTMASL